MLAAIVVTHNSELVLPRCLEALQQQTQSLDRIILVDSGSKDRSYLADYENSPTVTVLQTENVGYSRANNLGAAQVLSSCEFLLILNPDTFLESGFVARALAAMRQYPVAGIVSAKLLGYDLGTDKPVDRFDSTGIFRKWYGRWYDRGQGEPDTGQYDIPEEVPGACGALLFCRGAALNDILLPGGAIFDPDFFLYKEDIELCLRLRKSGWKILYQPDCLAWHGRGWNAQRRNIVRELRKMAARSEILLYKKHPSPYMIWALSKYFLVTLFNV